MTTRLPPVHASYKKLKGTISVTPTQLEWIPASGQSSSAPVVIPVGLIRNLQATPVHNPKVMIKVFISQDPNQEPTARVFTFTSPGARNDCDAIKEAIQLAIAERNRAKTVSDILRDGEDGLLRDTDLQMSLLRHDVELGRMFRALVIEGKQLADQQFWKARVHLLRAHAIERAQKRGPYNVLAVLKPKTQDGTTTVNLSADRKRDIFEQHPLVRRAYDENVPKLSEDEFWSRFLLSRLKKKLSGEKVTDRDPVDDIMDKYLRPDYDQMTKKRPRQEQVPNFIDLEGNEEHITKKSGNLPDRTMRPNEDIPIMHTINSLSRRMVDAVIQQPEHGATGTDASAFEEYIAQLRLGDLEPERSDDHVILNVNARPGVDFGMDVSVPEKNPAEALEQVRESMKHESVDLLTIGRNSGALSAAARHLTSEIQAQVQAKKQDQADEQLGLSESVLSQVHITHSTSVEFLRQFWMAYRSRAGSRERELDGLAQSLRRSQERIEAAVSYANVQGGEGMGDKVRESLQSVALSMKKALALWEGNGIGSDI